MKYMGHESHTGSQIFDLLLSIEARVLKFFLCSSHRQHTWRYNQCSEVRFVWLLVLVLLYDKLRLCNNERQDLSKGLEAAIDTAESINTEEGYFGMPPMRFPQIQQLTSALDPYLKLWSIADTFKRSEEEWMISWLNKLDTEKIESEVQ